MDKAKLRILVTGGEGYLGRQYIKKMVNDRHTELIISIDPANRLKIKQNPWKAKKLSFPEQKRFIDYWSEKRVIHLDFSVTDSDLIRIVDHFRINIVAHFAWWFNPTHFLEKQRWLDIAGTENVLYAAVNSSTVEQVIYTGSSTAYGQIPENTAPLKEEEWTSHSRQRLAAAYPYSRHKARIDLIFQRFQRFYPKIAFFWTRAAIVLGRNTPHNIAAYVARSPFTFGRFMFKVKGFDPPMQFLSEYDMIEILFLATVKKWTGPVNAAGEGTLPYSEVIRIFGREKIELPEAVLRRLCQLGWNLRIGDKSFLKFPPSLIDLIQYPWVGDIGLLQNKYDYKPLYSSVDALLQFKSIL